MTNFLEMSDLDLVDQLGERIAGDDELEQLLRQVQIRLLTLSAFANKAVYVLADLQSEALEAAGLAD